MSPLQFVLAAGIAVLLLYAGTQVFGVRLPGMGPASPERSYQQGQSAWSSKCCI